MRLVAMLPVALVVLVIAGMLVVEMIHRDDFGTHRRIDATETLATLRTRLQAALSNNLAPLEAIAVHIGSEVAEGDPEPLAELDHMASRLTDDRPAIRAIAVVRGSTFVWVHPRSGNEKLLGVDLRTLPAQMGGALQAIQERRLVVIGPLPLVQGGRAVLGRYPVEVRQADGTTSTWGLVSIAIDFAAIAHRARLVEALPPGALFAIRRVDADGTEVFHGPAEAFELDPVTLTLDVPGGGQWHLAMAREVGWGADPPLLPYIRGAGLGLAALFGGLALLLVRFTDNSRRAERAVRESEARYRVLAENAADVVWRMDSDLAFTYASPSAEALLGYVPDEIVGRTLWEFLPAAAAQKVRKALIERQEDLVARADGSGGAPRRLELPFYHRDGHLVWTEVTSRPLRDGQGCFVGFSGATRDISERRAAEQARNESEALFRTITETAPVGLVLAALDTGRIEAVNPRAAELLGIAADTAVGTVIGEVWPDADERRRILQAALAGHMVSEQEVPLDGGGDGSGDGGDGDRWALVTARPVGYRGLPATLIAMTDVSDLKRAQQTVRSQFLFHKALLDTMPIPIYHTDGAGHYLGCNGAFCRLLGLHESQVIGRTAYDIARPDDARLITEMDRALMRDGGGQTFETTLHGADGAVHEVLFNKTLYRNGDGSVGGIIGAMMDITERKAAERDLQRLATTDPLTGLPNRRHFLDLANQELERARRQHHPLALAMIDLDHFKTVNDQHGHAAGDEALRRFAEICRANLRAYDVIGRMGGEEFAVILAETDIVKARDLAERLRSAVADAELVWRGKPVRLTVSIGLSGLESGDRTVGECLQRADRALYEAKETGRNRVCEESAQSAAAG